MSQGYRIRLAVAADAEAIARVKVETWRTTYAGVVPDHYLLGMSLQGQTFVWKKMARRDQSTYAVLVAEVPGTGIVGFGDCGPGRDNLGRGTSGQEKLPHGTGEIYTLYVTGDWQGRGVGRALLTRLLSRLAAMGHSSAYLWVLAENPSRFFYERLGGERVAERLEHFAGSELLEYAYRWADLERFR